MSSTGSQAAAPESDAALARRVAVEAGQLLLRVRAQGGTPLDDAAKRALGDEADRTANDLILRRLTEARPHDAVLSEESPDDDIRLSRERVWIVDPLDGTSEFRSGRDEFAVHIALWENGELVAGSIALPDRGVVRTTSDPLVAPTSLDLDGELAVVLSRSHIPAGFLHVADRLEDLLAETGHPDARVTRYHVGSVGAKVDEVMAGRACLYPFADGMREWDTAAPFVVAARQGFVVATADGADQPYNQPEPSIRSGFVAHPDIADLVAAAVDGSGM